MVVAVALLLLRYPVALIAFVLLILGHEVGHAVLARRSGLEVSRIDLHGFGGRCVYFGDWATEWNRAVIAWGGIVVQAAILLPIWLWVKLLPVPDGWVGALLGQALLVLFPINLLILLFNLIPLAPLDGHQAWRIIPMLPARFGAWKRTRRARRSREERQTAIRKASVAGRAKARGLRVVHRDDTGH